MSLEPVNISHMLYDNTQNEESDENSCSICFMEMDENICTLDDCHHRFHTNCIVRWFRNGNSSCPCCRNTPLETTSYEKHGRYKFLYNYAKDKKAPKELKKLVEKINKKEKYIRECRKSIRDWKKTQDGKNWCRLDKIYNKLRRKIYTQSGICGLWSLREEISAYPILPIYVQQKITMNH